MKKILFLCFLCLTSVVSAYELDINNRTITYNPDTLKFYDNMIVLDKSEVQQMFPEYEVVLISKFSKDRKYVVKKSFFKPKKILLLNDDTRTFHDFFVYPESSRDSIQKYENGEIKSLITIYGKKNVRLKHSGGDEFEIVVK